MSILILDPKPVVLFDMIELGTAEVVSAPIAMWSENESKRTAGLAELQVSLFGNLTTAAKDLLIKMYHCPGAIAEHQDRAPYTTENIDCSAGGNLGTERVTNGDFALSTGWSVPSWTIGSGVATHNGASRSRLARKIESTTLGGHLMKMKVTDLGTGDWRLRAGLRASPLPTGLIQFLDVNALPAGESVPHTFARYVPGIPVIGTGHEAEIYVEVDNDGFIIDDVSLAQCTPYRQTAMIKFEDVGASLVLGFLPSGTLAGIYMHAAIRRYTTMQ